jgi:hypothetical protein
MGAAAFFDQYMKLAAVLTIVKAHNKPSYNSEL